MIRGNNVSAYMASTLVLLVAIGFYAYSKIILFGTGEERYPLQAQFFSSNTIHPGGKVVLSGIPVGVIRSIHLNKQTFMSDVEFEINKNIKLPKDSQFVIGSIGMTDDGVIFIHPGKDKTILQPKDFITNTLPYISLEQQISNYIFGSMNTSS